MQLLTSSLKDQMVEWRHAFHQNPELGFEEHWTSSKVAEILSSFGVSVETGVGGTGVVGVLSRGDGSQSVGIRADMDALPIHEAVGLSYASQSQGKMHACGHDGHTTMLLGAAAYLAKYGRFNGTAVFFFQPNEENGLGAKAMLSQDLLARYPVNSVYGMHNIPGMPLGTFATRAGPMTASESLFEIIVTAKGGHAALPHMGVDAITVGTQIVQALQTIVSRKLDPALNGVVSVTEFITDGRRNVLPGQVILRGDSRALTPDINNQIEQRMREIVDGVCMAHGVHAEVSYQREFQPTINSANAAKAAVQAASDVVGENHVDGDCGPKLFSEDFAEFAAQIPGCFVLMGNGLEGRSAKPLHANDYDFNDDGLTIGSSFWARLIEQELA